MKNVIIVGGGLAGLVTAILLKRNGVPCTLYEKKAYPLQRVCGEYVSNEALRFLQQHDLFPAFAQPNNIDTLQLSSIHGKFIELKLDLGGFGLSRLTFDQFLYDKALSEGVDVFTNCEVTSVMFNQDRFLVDTTRGEFEADIVIGAYGKRSKLDQQLQRSFMRKRSPFIGVKYHVRSTHPDHLIALHNFEGGYCGINNVDGNRTNLCYLSHRDNLKKFGDIRDMEENVLYKNPLLREFFQSSFIDGAKPEVINEISFETKNPVEAHMLMVGDSAGMITPLCGNGMAMAIHAAKLAAEHVLKFANGQVSRVVMETGYEALWREKFQRRLWYGRQVQRLFGNRHASSFAVQLAKSSRLVADAIIRRTHGEVF